MSGKQSRFSKKHSLPIKSLLVVFVLIAGFTMVASAASDSVRSQVPASQSGPGDDFDGIDPALDNCPLTFNPDQQDTNDDGIGDACDLDNDGVENQSDNCPFVSNADQQDDDQNGAGDACDNGYDKDLDGILDSTETYLMETFAPLMYLYGADYRPSSVDWLLGSSQTALGFDFGVDPYWDAWCETDGFQDFGYLRRPIGNGMNLLGITALHEEPMSPMPPPMCVQSWESSSLDGVPGSHFYIDIDPSIYGGNLVSAPYYAQISRGAAYRVFIINYWFFYPYNGCGYDWAGVEYCNWTHEGDWEHIVVYVQQSGDGSYSPFRANYYYHGEIALYDWSSLQTSPDGNRPIGFSALHTHASYADGGNHDSCIAEDDFGTCWWYRRDYTDDGVLWDPISQTYTVINTGESYPMDLPEGGVINVGEKPLTRSRSYFDPSMGVPMPGTEWIFFQGHWGRQGGGPGTPSLHWYDSSEFDWIQRLTRRVNPPAVWKVPDQSAITGVFSSFDIGRISVDPSTPSSRGEMPTLSIQIDWGDGSPRSGLFLPFPSPSTDVSAGHLYSSPGDYFVTVVAAEEFGFVDYGYWGGNVFKVTVGEPPVVANPIADVTVDEDAPDTSIDLWLVFDDSEDPDSQMTYSVVLVTNGPLFTSAAVPDSRHLVLDYAPDVSGTAEITVRATNMIGLSADDMFMVTVNPVNDAPAAVDDGPYTATGGEALAVAAPGVLGNDTDVEGDPLKALLGRGPAHGLLALISDGSFVYTPDPFHMGADSFTYRANDGALGSNLATVTFEVGQGGTLVCDEAVVRVGNVELAIPAGALPTCVYVNIVPVSKRSGPVDPDTAISLDHRYDIRIRRTDGVYLQLFSPALQLCYIYNDEDLERAGDDPNRFQIWTSDGDWWQKLNVNRVEQTERRVCAPVSHLSYFDLFLQVHLPETGFAPGVVTRLPDQPMEKAYTGLGELWLEIPRLGLQAPIVGVPLSGESWNVSWLADQVGWLEGTAFPTWEGNSSLTAHVYDANGEPGPFVHLRWLWYGDEIIVHAWGQEYVYAVRSVRQVGVQDVSPILKHEDFPWLTLITCRGYDEASDTYRYRIIIRAVQINIRTAN
jgi:LPXTG-site transpeptidase (sortase) family protein